MQLTRNARAAFVAAILGAALVGGAVGWATLQRLNVSVTDLGVVTPDGLVDANNSPTVKIDPTDPAHVVIVNRVDRPSYGAIANISRDGGRTWTTMPLPLPGGLDRPFAPDAGFDTTGRLYVTYAHLVGRGNVPDGLWLTTMEPGDDTFTDPVSIAGSLAFQPRLAVGAAGTVHVTYLQAESVGLYQLIGRAPVVMITSTDGGESFNDPVRVSSPTHDLVGAAVPTVDAAGNVIALYVDFGEDLADFQDLPGPVHDGQFRLYAARFDTDGRLDGESMIAAITPTERFLVFLPDFPDLTASSDGGLTAAWTGGSPAGEVVLTSGSNDGGVTWSTPALVSPADAATGTDQYSPAVAVDADGNLSVLYLDRSGDPAANTMTDAVIAHGTADRFVTTTLTSEPFDASWGPRAQPYHDPDLGTRIGIARDGDAVLVAWTDTRQGDPIVWRQDIRAARVVFGTVVDVRRAVLAAVLAAAVTAALGMILHRRTTGSTRTASEAEHTDQMAQR